MPLPAGVRLDRDVHPTQSWPPTPAASLAAPPLPKGRGRPARVAEDGTRWCAYGDHTVDPDSKVQRCDSCHAFRDRIRKTPVGTTFVALPTEVALGLIAAARELDRAVQRVRGQISLNQDPTLQDLQALITTASRANDIASIAAEFLGI